MEGVWHHYNEIELPARSILVAAGTQPNTVLAREDSVHVHVDGRYFQACDENGNAVKPERSAKPLESRVLLSRMEGGRFHTVHSATTKAVCAASNRRPTASHGAVGQSLDVAHAIGLALAAGPERWTAMEGGCPVIFDGQCVGGVGIAGGSWEHDQTLAREAVESIGAKAA